MTDQESRWNWVALGEVCEVIMGQSPPSSTYRDEPRGLPFFQGKADFGMTHPTARKWCIAPKKIARPGDVLLSIRAPVGPTNIADIECCIGRGLAAVRGGPDIDQKFLHYALQFVESEIVEQGTGSTFQSISGKRLKAIMIPVPPIDQQRQLVADLNRQLAVLERAETAVQVQLVALEAMPAALLRKFFPRSRSAILNRGTRWVRLGDICTVKKGRTPRADWYADTGIRLIRFRDVALEGISWEPGRRSFVDAQYADNLVALEPETLLVTADAHDPASIGKKVAFVDAIPDEAGVPAYSGEMLGVRAIDQDARLTEFVRLWLASEGGYAEIQMHTSGGHLNVGPAREMLIPLVSNDERRRIIEQVAEVENALSRCRRLAEARADTTILMRSAILREVFTS